MSILPNVSKFNSKSRHLSDTEVAEFAQRLEAIRTEVMTSLGQRDADYINRVLNIVRGSEFAGRGLLMTLGWLPPAWLAGTALLGFSKIVENMELGHNVMHGQYDWMNDAKFSGATYDWDNICAATMWKHSHNYMHHTYTNIIDKDLDIGYDSVRMTNEQTWQADNLLNFIKVFYISTFFQWAVGYHDIQVTRHEYANHPDKENMLAEKWQDFRKKIIRQVGKDYVALPLLSGINFLPTLSGNAVANLIRNYWAFAIIFCGHFSADVEMFDKKVLENESKGDWYNRQIKGSGNISGGKFFHFLSGNLSHQIEHHLFPDMPANRYQEIAPQVRALCEEYGIHYNTGNFAKQFSEVMVRIAVFSFPNKVLAERIDEMTVSGLGHAVGRAIKTYAKPTQFIPKTFSKIFARVL